MTKNEFPCPFCDDVVFPLLNADGTPKGSWLCVTCSVASGNAIACDAGIGTRPLLRLVDSDD